MSVLWLAFCLFLGLCAPFSLFTEMPWRIVGKKSVSLMKVALQQIGLSDSLLKFLPEQFYVVKNTIWTLILFFMQKWLANKKHIANTVYFVAMWIKA